MIRLLAARNLMLNPWRSLFLLFGFSMGVAVMIVDVPPTANSRDPAVPLRPSRICVVCESSDVHALSLYRNSTPSSPAA